MLTQMHYRVWISSFYSQTWQFKAATHVSDSCQSTFNYRLFLLLLSYSLYNLCRGPLLSLLSCLPVHDEGEFSEHDILCQNGPQNQVYIHLLGPVFSLSRLLPLSRQYRIPVHLCGQRLTSESLRENVCGRDTKKFNNSTRCE